MKRDMRLIRKILEFIEERTEIPTPGSFELTAADAFKDDDEYAVDYHSYLLLDAGYVKGIYPAYTASRKVQNHASISQLTWSGHDYLDALRAHDGVAEDLPPGKAEMSQP